MNYFEIIQEVSKLYRGKPPVLFSEITNKKYYEILSVVKNANADFMRSKRHNFRRKKTVLNTIIGQQEYPNIYGNIIENGLYISNNDTKRFIKFKSSFEKILLNNESQQGMPLYYSIFNNKIIFDNTPDSVYNINILYNTNNFVKQVHSINTESLSGQKNIYLSSTQGLSQFDTIIIEPDTQREEIKTIDTITVDDHITLTENLIYTHQPNSKIIKEKKEFTNETDEPNFSDDWHQIVVYDAMKRLSFDDAGELQKYSTLSKQMYNDIETEQRGSADSHPYFKIG